MAVRKLKEKEDSPIIQLIGMPVINFCVDTNSGYSSKYRKRTIEYALENEVAIKRKISNAMSTKKYGTAEDENSVFSDLIEYLAKSNDYDIINEYDAGISVEKGIERYVINCAYICIKRVSSSQAKEHNMKISYNAKNEDSECSLLDVLKDSSAEEDIADTMYLDVDSYIKPLQSKEIKYGENIISLLYACIKTESENLSKNQKKKVINTVVGQVRYVSEIRRDEDILIAIRALSKLSEDGALSTLRKYLYGAAQIDRIIEAVK